MSTSRQCSLTSPAITSFSSFLKFPQVKCQVCSVSFLQNQTASMHKFKYFSMFFLGGRGFLKTKPTLNFSLPATSTLRLHITTTIVQLGGFKLHQLKTSFLTATLLWPFVYFYLNPPPPQCGPSALMWLAAVTKWRWCKSWSVGRRLSATRLLSSSECTGTISGFSKGVCDCCCLVFFIFIFYLGGGACLCVCVCVAVADFPVWFYPRLRQEGAILVFLPGWDNISSLNDLLVAQQMFRSGTRTSRGGLLNA